MADAAVAEKYKTRGREIYKAERDDADLGPLKLLPGHWHSERGGWNMIALPFAPPGINFRILMNQYQEDLKFTLVDKGVPNRGIDSSSDKDTDQFLVTLDYEQQIKQIAVEDSPKSTKAGAPGLAIHHEPGLWLHMTNETTKGLDIARLATIPHGDSVLALGKSETIEGKPEIPVQDGLPIGVSQDLSNLDNKYLEPYRHFEDDPFFGNVPSGTQGFPGFFPTDLNAILRFALDADPTPVVKTTILHVDTTLQDAGIVNIPFIVREANATEMKSTFWIQELDEKDEYGKPKLRLQYSQLVFLDFFKRPGDSDELIRWPHVSINTLDKVSDVVV